MYFGTDGPDGTFHSVLEVLANSIDEAREGFGSDIWLTIHKDNSYTVKDQGRGLPMGMNKKYNEYNYKLTMETLHAGGKMDNTKADANYENSLGTNGVGLTATNFSSKWCKAEGDHPPLRRHTRRRGAGVCVLITYPLATSQCN